MRYLPISLLLFLGACKGPITAPGQLMVEVESYPAAASADKALVFIHRPRAYQGHPLYLGVWMDREPVADLGNGHTTYLELDPGRHTFVGRSVEVKTVIHAEVQAGQTYDLWADTAGAWIASFRLLPVDPEDVTGEELEAWLGEHKIVRLEPRDPAEMAAFKEEYLEKIDVILQEAAAGDLQTYEMGPQGNRP